MKKLMVSLFRAGKLSTAEKFVNTAEEKVNGDVKNKPGLYFCRGLLKMYKNNPREALEDFNHVRMDAEWGAEALVHMIKIYINPENILDGAEGSSIREESIAAAQRLLEELKQPMFHRTISDHRRTTLEASILIHMNTKTGAESAVKLLANLLQDDREDVAAIVSLAKAFQVMKQTPKVKSNLKRVAKMEFDQRYAEDFENGWLMLAEMYIGNNKNESARVLLKLVLQHNKSSLRAWDLLGLILEKDGAFEDASESYASAWKLTDEKDPKIGYKLAYNLMKSKKYIKSIDVCHKVLRQFPDFVKIRKEVLDQCRPFLRM